MCFLLKIIIPSAKLSLHAQYVTKKGVTEMVMIYIACSNKNENNISADISALTEESMQNASLEPDSKRLKCS